MYLEYIYLTFYQYVSLKKGCKMKKFLVRLLCCFIPSRKMRHDVRKNAFKTEHTLEKLVNQIQYLQQQNISSTELNQNIENLVNQIQYLQQQKQEINQNLDCAKRDIHDWLFRDGARLIATAELHKQTFAGYRNKFAGKTVVLVGAGPSLNKFKPIKNAIYVGLNSALLFDKVKFDFFFTIDNGGIKKIYDKVINYDCVKFIGDQNLGKNWQIPESVIHKIPNAKRYKTDVGFISKFALDIEYEPLANFNTVSLQAMQFILYTNPAKIYLVGIDCSSAGHFTDNNDNHRTFDMASRGEDVNVWANDTTKYWHQLKEFADTYYPETEIISVNPVGLRGLFTDLDQK